MESVTQPLGVRVLHSSAVRVLELRQVWCTPHMCMYEYIYMK